MASNNQGIAHLSYNRPGGDTLCNNRNAIVSVTIAKFREGGETLVCKRCLGKLAKMDTLAARKAAR